MPFRHNAAVELRHLRYFVTVANLLNFTKAAQQLRVAQPALSRQIRDLEVELGAPLLERGPRLVRLTAAGAAFLPEARAVLERATTAVDVVRAVAKGERGEIHVGYAPSLTIEMLPCALHSFHNAAPGVQVKLHDLSSEEMVRGVSEGRLHVSLVARPGAKSLGALKFELLREYPICVGMPPAHRLARSKQVELAQIADEKFAAYSRSDYPEYHAMLLELFARIGRTPQIAEEHDSAPSLIAAAEIGRGLVIAPACLGMLAGPRLKFRPLHPAPPPVQLGALYDPQHLPAAAAKFLTATRSTVNG
jgi:LysR family transcriptional regulator, benzoate and cis,cis-muconate-responsive activator of ben and cat genes